MEDESLYTKNQPKEISEGLQHFIDSMVEEIVLENKPFDSQKKYLRKFSENEGLDYNRLEENVITFIEILDTLKTTPTKLMVKYAEEKGRDCLISDRIIKELLSNVTINMSLAEIKNDTSNKENVEKDKRDGGEEIQSDNNIDHLSDAQKEQSDNADSAEEAFVWFALIATLFALFALIGIMIS